MPPNETGKESVKQERSGNDMGAAFAGLSDEDIAKRCQDELPYETAAYRELLRRYEPLVHRTCLKMLGNVEDAEEVTQDACLRIFHKIESFEARSKFKTWLFRIVTNLCIDRRRKLARDSEKTAEIQAGILHQAEATKAASANDEALAEAMNETLSKLKEDDRRIVVLRFISGLSLEEISEVMEIGLSATKMRLYRALESFKTSYSKLDAVPAGGVNPKPALKK